MLLKPETLKEAKLYVGTSFKRWWEATPVSDAGWYAGVIDSVTDETLITTNGKREAGLFVHLK